MLKLKFEDLFNRCREQPYSVIKLSPSFPNYSLGDDIDIYCRDINSFATLTLGFLDAYVDSRRSVRVKEKPNKIQIDLIEKGGDIHFRFDLFAAQPPYDNVSIKPSFFDVVIETSQLESRSGVELKVPHMMDECILRYIEYTEYFGVRPDKIKHVDFINKRIDEGQLDRERLFKRLHYFVALPETYYRGKTFLEKLAESYSLMATLLGKAYHLFKAEGIGAVLKRIAHRYL